ncbi:MAG: hypothetical protein JEZ03_07675, partial [Bacteroidales bacterium]|nr:hypothetical protein [Bacteroidales bacterium]
MFESVEENQIVYLIFAGVFIMFFLALLVILFFNYSRNKILQQSSINQQMQLDHQENLLRSNILIQEQERSRIAAELHDDIGVKLSVVRLYVNQIKKHISNGFEVESLVLKTNEILDSSIDATRRISHELLPPVLEEFGLESALKEFIQHTSDASDLQFEL